MNRLEAQMKKIYGPTSAKDELAALAKTKEKIDAVCYFVSGILWACIIAFVIAAAFPSVINAALAASAIAQTPNPQPVPSPPSDFGIVITGPKESSLGDLVILDASASKGAKSFAWTLVGSAKTFLPVDGGKQAVFASGTPGTYVFVLAIAGGDRVAIAQHSVTIGTPTPVPVPPPPPPGPNPNPPPPPPNPNPSPDVFGLRPVVVEAVALVAESERARAPQIGGTYRTIAKQIEDEKLFTSAQILDATTKANRALLGESAKAWAPFSHHLGKKLAALSQDGSMRTAEQYRVAWNAIADAMGAK